MLTNKISLLFHLKRPRNYVKGDMLLYLRITVDSQRTELSLNRRFDPLRWNQKAERASGTKEDAKALNAYIETTKLQVYEAHRELLETKEIITIEKLKNKLSGKDENRPKMFLEIFKEHNQQMLQLIEANEYAKGHTLILKLPISMWAIFFNGRIMSQILQLRKLIMLSSRILNII